MTIIDYLKIIVFISFFYSFAITILSYTLPERPPYIFEQFQKYTETYNIQNTTYIIEQYYQRQTNIPLADMAALVFYSGNIFIDLLLNFVFAIPSMLTLLLDALFRLINVPAAISALLKLTVYSLSFVLYMIYLISAVVSIRTGRLIIQ